MNNMQCEHAPAPLARYLLTHFYSAEIRTECLVREGALGAVNIYHGVRGRRGR